MRVLLIGFLLNRIVFPPEINKATLAYFKWIRSYNYFNFCLIVISESELFFLNSISDLQLLIELIDEGFLSFDRRGRERIG